MKNKKIIVALLVVVMVLSMAAVCLTACDDSEWDDIEAEALAAMMDNAINNLAPTDALLNNTEIAANLDVKAKYGDSSKNYGIAFAVKLGLDKADDNTNAFSLVITDKADNSVAFGAYYDESLGKNYNDKVYLQGPGGNLALQAVKVKDVIKDQNADISDSWCEEAQGTVLDALSEYFSGIIIQTVGGLGDTKISKDGKVARLELPLTTLLQDKSSTGLGGLLESVGSPMVDPYLEKLGIDLKVAQLVDILPKLTVALQFTFEGSGVDTTLKNIQAELSCGAKNVKINKTNNKGTLLELDIAKDFSATVSADFFVAPSTSMVKLAPTSVYEAEVVNALNFTLKGEVNFDKEIKASVGPLNLNIPSGDYNVTIALDADPTALIGMTFPKEIKDEVTGEVIKKPTTQEILTCVGDVLEEAVDYMLLDIKSKTASASDNSLLKLELSRAAVGAPLKVSATELDALGMNVNISGLTIAEAISTIAKLFPAEEPTPEEPEVPTPEAPSGDQSGSVSGETDEEKTDAILASIKPYVELLSIIIKGGSAQVNLDGAEFDIKDGEGKVTSTVTLDAGITVNGEAITVTGHAVGLDKLLAGLPEDINATIKVTEFKLGNAGK